jgi:hypothetical protein
LESILCHCKIWCKTMPSTKPPKPMPRTIPARCAFLCGTCVAIKMFPRLAVMTNAGRCRRILHPLYRGYSEESHGWFTSRQTREVAVTHRVDTVHDYRLDCLATFSPLVPMKHMGVMLEGVDLRHIAVNAPGTCGDLSLLVSCPLLYTRHKLVSLLHRLFTLLPGAPCPSVLVAPRRTLWMCPPPVERDAGDSDSAPRRGGALP